MPASKGTLVAKNQGDSSMKSRKRTRADAGSENLAL